MKFDEIRDLVTSEDIRKRELDITSRSTSNALKNGRLNSKSNQKKINIKKQLSIEDNFFYIKPICQFQTDPSRI